jgi:hypothetical protein
MRRARLLAGTIVHSHPMVTALTFDRYVLGESYMDSSGGSVKTAAHQFRTALRHDDPTSYRTFMAARTEATTHRALVRRAEALDHPQSSADGWLDDAYVLSALLNRPIDTPHCELFIAFGQARSTLELKDQHALDTHRHTWSGVSWGTYFERRAETIAAGREGQPGLLTEPEYRRQLLAAPPHYSVEQVQQAYQTIHALHDTSMQQRLDGLERRLVGETPIPPHPYDTYFVRARILRTSYRKNDLPYVSTLACYRAILYDKAHLGDASIYASMTKVLGRLPPAKRRSILLTIKVMTGRQRSYTGTSLKPFTPATQRP